MNSIVAVLESPGEPSTASERESMIGTASSDARWLMPRKLSTSTVRSSHATTLF
jgi:hypothetical protein